MSFRVTALYMCLNFIVNRMHVLQPRTFCTTTCSLGLAICKEYTVPCSQQMLHVAA